MVLLELDLQGHLDANRSKFALNGFVRTITCRVFKLGSPNLHPICILGFSRSLLEMVLIDLYFKVIWGKNGPNRPKTVLNAR